MADAVISRANGTSVTLPIIEEGRTLAVARDVGKPNAKPSELGREDIFVQDNYSAGDAFTIKGKFQGSSAYADAKTLAEDIIKPQLPDNGPISLDLSALPSRSTYNVAAATDNACQLTYRPGAKNEVEVQLTLNVVKGVSSSDAQIAQTHGSPDSGTGLKIDRSGTSVTLSTGEEIVRKVGRPGTNLLPSNSDLPPAFDNNVPANDTFEISAELRGSNAESDAQTLEQSIVRPRLQKDTLTLHFLDDLFTLDAYDVVPTGSQAVRTVFRTGETSMVGVPTLKLRVADNRSDP